MTSWNQKSTSSFICCCAIKILATITPSSCLLSIPHPSYLIISTIFLLSLLLHPHTFSLSPCPFCSFPLPLSWFPHVSFSYSILPLLLPTLFCSISPILSPFLAFCTCCIHCQPPVMHIYCLQQSCLIQHVPLVRVNLLPPLAYIQPCLLLRATQTPIIYCVIYLWIKSFNFLLTSISQGGEDDRAD